ncbi:MAG: hypothetical protein R3B99_18475 [Polyangiales bacterium]
MIRVAWAVRRATGAELAVVTLGQLARETGLDALALRRALRGLRSLRTNEGRVLEVVSRPPPMRMRLTVTPSVITYAILHGRQIARQRRGNP